MASERTPNRNDALSDEQRLAGALLRIEAWARQRGLDEVAALLSPAIDRLDRDLTGVQASSVQSPTQARA